MKGVRRSDSLTLLKGESKLCLARLSHLNCTRQGKTCFRTLTTGRHEHLMSLCRRALFRAAWLKPQNITAQSSFFSHCHSVRRSGKVWQNGTPFFYHHGRCISTRTPLSPDIDHYLTFRLDSAERYQFTTEEWVNILANSREVSQKVVSDIISLPTQDYRRVVEALLSCRDALASTPHSSVLELVHTYLSSGGEISGELGVNLAIAISSHVDKGKDQSTVAHHLTSATLASKRALMDHLPDIVIPMDLHIMDYNLPNSARAVFGVIYRLLFLDLQHDALDLFQQAASMHLIPPSTMKDLESSENGLHYIISLASSRAALHWNVHNFSPAFVTHLYPSHSRDELLRLHVSDILIALISKADEYSLRRALRLLTHVGKTLPMPQPIFTKLYDMAHHLRAVNIAEDLYFFSRTSAFVDLSYHPPQDVVLPWLMQHLSSDHTRRRWLSLMLARDVLYQDLSVPPAFRGQFIVSLVRNGHTTVARGLYDQWSTGRDGYLIRGNHALISRFASLWSTFYERATVELGVGPAEIPNVEPPALAQQSLPLDASSKQLESSHIMNRPPPTAVEQFRSFDPFMKNALASFEKSIHPVHEAGHVALNALASAYFHLRRPVDAFNTLNIIIRRGEQPDRYDLSVALRGVAAASAKAAFDMLERMRQNGLEPSSGDYGIVLLAALKRNELDVVGDIERQMDSMNLDMTLHSVDALIRASRKRDSELSQTVIRQELQQTSALLHEMTTRGIRLPPALGIFLVGHALRANLPGLAFAFWRRMMSESIAWNNPGHKEVRRAIRRSVQSRAGRGLDVQNAELMVNLLSGPKVPIVWPTGGSWKLGASVDPITNPYKRGSLSAREWRH
ncbi:hypothetical protein DL96DRAFT_1557759 [Flagelloscypha sp. PMI_526]|nr:hypothetical protein DL96DRAFT_1557759 [Flagelloscypha sp. PMI_526]